MTYLLDASVVIALSVHGHEHHDDAHAWFAEVDQASLCPIAEGALVRFLVWIGERPSVAQHVLERLLDDPRVTWCPDDLSYRSLELSPLLGHRQVTDAYLVGLAVARGEVVATIDRGLAAVWPERAMLVPTGS